MEDWKNEYRMIDTTPSRNLSSEDGKDLGYGTGRYEIVFQYEGVRRKCFIDAVSADEALGNFFRNHSNVTYDMIVEYIAK